MKIILCGEKDRFNYLKNQLSDFGWKDEYVFPIHINDRTSLRNRLAECTDYSSVKIIVEESFYKINDNHTIIRDYILSFPEVFFCFVQGKSSWRTIFELDYEADDSLFTELCSLPENYSSTDLKRVLSINLLFDASNLRFAAKIHKFEELKVFQNYSELYNSRSMNLATILDEEYLMAQRISYSLFVSGYRALPINSYFLFNEINKEIRGKKGILIRDFDLQFADAPTSSTINKVDYIRGYKLNDNFEWEPKYSEKEEDIVDFWDGFRYSEGSENSIPVYCISHGYSNLKIESCAKPREWRISENKKTLHAPGVNKPILGIYQSINEFIGETHERVESIRRDLKKTKTSRIGHDHSMPLDLYNIVVPMLYRAEYYYKEGKYILAAVLSQESIELLNGMHVSLGHRAYLIHAKAENAIAMSEIGGDEAMLAEDCRTRIEYIIEDINRLDKPYEIHSHNVLNQIYADCRQYCHEKEHFKSEEVFINAMAELNDGLDLLTPVKNWFKNIYHKTKINEKNS